MRVVIAGSRSVKSLGIVYHAIKKSGFEITEVISGDADGVDTIGELWAELKGLPCVRYPADWKQHGKKAGPIRNREMAEVCDAAILVWDGWSPGTSDMIDVMIATGKPMYVYKVDL